MQAYWCACESEGFILFCICHLFQFDTSSNEKSVVLLINYLSKKKLITESLHLLTWMKLLNQWRKIIEVFLFARELIFKYLLKLNYSF